MPPINDVEVTAAPEGGAVLAAPRVGARLADRLRAEWRDPTARSGLWLLVNTAVTAITGFLYWVIAARLYPVSAVGRAGALISAVSLLAGIGQLNLSGALMRFLPEAGPHSRRLVLLAYGGSATISILVTCVAGVGVHFLTQPGSALRIPLAASILFVLSVAATVVFSLQDNVLIGLGRTLWVPIENGLFGIAKAVLLFALVALGGWGAIFASWMLPLAATLPLITWLLFGWLLPRGGESVGPLPSEVRERIRRFVVADAVAGLATQTAGYLLPVIVTVMLGARANALFYAAFLFASMLDNIAINYTLPMIVHGAGHPHEVRRIVLATTKRVYATLVPPVVFFLLAGSLVLHIYGHVYVRAAAALAVMAVACLPKALLQIYYGVCRIQQRTDISAVMQVAVATAVIVGAAVFAHDGIVAVSAVILVASTVAALVAVPAMLAPGRLARASESPVAEGSVAAGPLAAGAVLDGPTRERLTPERGPGTAGPVPADNGSGPLRRVTARAGKPVRRGESGSPLWLTGDGPPLYAVHHRPSTAARATGVVFVSPFGWEEIESHRARRLWAVDLANHGHHVVRYDLPGTGDSAGGPREANLFGAWTASVATVAAWLRAEARCQRVAVIGVGFGGLLATAALAEGAPVDDLVLWAARAQGRRALRELRAYASVAASKISGEDPGPPLGETLDIAGLMISEATRRDLEARDVAKLRFPPLNHRRALLLGRDGSPPDPGLSEALRRAGCAVITAPSADFKALMAHPQSPVIERPVATMNGVRAFLLDGERLPAAPSAPRPVRRRASVIITGGSRGPVRETTLDLRLGETWIDAVITESVRRPKAPLTAVLFNSGAVRKVGPHRMSVEIARRWAARGIVTVRLDREAVGDAEGPGDVGRSESPRLSPLALGDTDSVAAAACALAKLRELGLRTPFLVGGHCSGAYLAFHLALTEPDVAGCFGINQPAFLWEESISHAGQLAAIRQALRHGLVSRVREQGVTAHEVRQVVSTAVFRLRHLGGATVGERQQELGVRPLDRLAAREVRALLVLSRGELLREILSSPRYQALRERWPNLAVEELPTTDHMAAALWIQAQIHARLDRHLDDVMRQVLTRRAPVAAPAP
jgi:alpha-beta hydrolase superfamily lysophospholipase/O-antigen/teichoic acid export membrane protein